MFLIKIHFKSQVRESLLEKLDACDRVVDMIFWSLVNKKPLFAQVAELLIKGKLRKINIKYNIQILYIE